MNIQLNRTMREEMSIGKIDTSRYEEFLKRHNLISDNLIGDNLLGGIEQEREHEPEQIGKHENIAIKNKPDKSMNKREL